LVAAASAAVEPEEAGEFWLSAFPENSPDEVAFDRT
jgi:hypothetical protein